MNEHIDGDDYGYPPGTTAGNLDRNDGTLLRAQPRPLTGPERTDAEIADVRRDLANALATIQDQNRRLAVLEHRVRLLESAEGTL